MQTQLSGRAVLRLLRLRNFAADASLGVAYTHFGSGALASGLGSDTWGPILGLDLTQRINGGLSGIIGASLTKYELPESGASQTDLRVGAGLQFRIRPWPE